MARLALMLIPLLCWAAPQLPAQKKPVFITASFIGKNRLFLEDLSREEIRVFENGEPREIAYFAGKEVQVVYGLLFDRAILPEPFQEPRREANQIPPSMAAANVAFQLLDQSLANHVGWAASYDKELQTSIDFTADSGRVKDSIQAMRGQRTSQESYLYSALFNAIQKMNRRNEKRRILILFLNTLDRDTGDRLKPLKNLLSASNMELFVASFASRSDSGTRGLPSAHSEAALRELAGATAGTAYFSYVESLEGMGRRISNQIRTLYTIGFESGSIDGQPSTLKIECTRPGVKITAHPVIPNLQ
jgi:VWFA-related protein